MKCERCNVNNATHHYKKSINGVVTEKYLCAACAAGESLPIKIFASGTAFAPLSFAPIKVVGSEPRVMCKVCGTTLDEFNETAYLGCASCYDELKPYLDSVIKKLHGSKQHVGKVPTSRRAEANRAMERSRMQRLLERSINEENFEEAAMIRDKIKSIDIATEGKE